MHLSLTLGVLELWKIVRYQDLYFMVRAQVQARAKGKGYALTPAGNSSITSG